MPFQLDKSLFSPDAIKNIILENKAVTREERSGPAIAFLPEGRHVIRWFMDPRGKLFREVMVGRVGKKRFVCPDFLARNDKGSGIAYPVCEIDRIAKERDSWKEKCRYHCIAYGQLYDTKSPGDYWNTEDNKPVIYAIIGNTHLKKALLDMLENLLDNGMDMLQAMLCPTSRGYFSSVNVTKGQQGRIAIQVLTKNVDPIELDDWYVPLTDVYMPNEFDEQVYGEALTEFLANLSKEEGGGHQDVLEELDAQSTSVLDSFSVSSAPPMGTPMVPPIQVSTRTDSVLDVDAIDLSPRVRKPEVAAAAAAKRVVPAGKRKAGDIGNMPDGITLELLPTGCPGWGNYTTGLMTCGLCDFNMECMKAGDAQT